MSKKKNINIKCVPATIRKCNGIVIEALGGKDYHKNVNKIITDAIEDDYHVYYLRHTETDWSTPRYVVDQPILVNRFGWFITKNIMKFNDNGYPSIQLSSRNAVFYNFKDYDSDVETYSYFMDSMNLNAKEYLNNSDKVWNKILSI